MIEEAERDAADAEFGFAVERMTAAVRRVDDLDLSETYSDLMIALAHWLELQNAELEATKQRLTR